MPTVPTVPTEYGHGDAEDVEGDADGDGPARVPQARRGHAPAPRPLVAEEAVPAAAAATAAAAARRRRPRRGALALGVVAALGLRGRHGNPKTAELSKRGGRQQGEAALLGGSAEI